MRRGLLAGLALAVVVGAVVWTCGWQASFRDSARVQDALDTAAPEVLHDLAKSARDGQTVLDEVLLRHHEASVSPIWLDESHAPVDAWGTRFRVRTDEARPPLWVVCESAGPDRRFGTSDDLSRRAP